VRRFLANEEGFTIQELMIVLVIGSILIGGIWSLYLFAEKVSLTWKRTSEFSEAASEIFATLTADLGEAYVGMALTDTSLIIVKDRWGRTVKYQFRDGQVVRNRVSLYQVEGSTLTIRIKITERGPSGEPAVVSVEMKGQSRGSTFERSASVRLPASSVFSYNAAMSGTLDQSSGFNP
jgi:prepilin-type N-terminal cleavage/methylation domain-containing protein